MNRSNLSILGSIAACALVVLSTVEAHAGWSVTVRQHCRWWSQKYVARAHAGCGVLLLCSSHSSSCGTASASCSKKTCMVGYAQASSYCGPSGWGGSSAATGNGFAGLEGRDGGTEVSASHNRAEGSVIFDEAAGAVILMISDSEFSAAADGSFSELEAIVSFLPGTEQDPVDDAAAPPPTADQILWRGLMRLEADEIRFAGDLSIDDMAPATERTLASSPVVRCQRVAMTIPVPAGVSFEQIEVTIRCDSGFGQRLEQPSYTHFLRGDFNGDGGVDLGDAIASLSFLFRGSRPSTCMDAANANGIGGFDLSDPIFTLTWFFLGGPQPPAPGPFECGPQPGGRSMGCDSYDVCAAKPSDDSADGR
jgi:hypothetical protein